MAGAWDVLIGLARGMRRIHGRRVIHRDLTEPGKNALLKRDGDRGLHPHILKMWQPLVVRLPKPVTLGVQGAARQIALASHSAHGTGPA